MKYACYSVIFLFLSLGVNAQEGYKQVKFVNYFDCPVFVRIVNEKGATVKNVVLPHVDAKETDGSATCGTTSTLMIPKIKGEKLYYQIKTPSRNSYSRLYRVKLHGYNWLHDSQQLLTENEFRAEVQFWK
jgi:hypothetical protein